MTAAGFPSQITREQVVAAAAALGLPPDLVTHFSLDVDHGVSVTLQIRSRTGDLLARDDDEPLTANLFIPYADRTPAKGSSARRA
ncbi:hypothetical protein OG401_21085 [Kitasatospora purpeofusca]|uniref:hypothetical protein n=1 Tax=Kitasatospora purpeofusca TaxID=67352 RepID=UPI00225AC53A|nr:hypothetical protein [Kitasatospora purpeofusca]MCX4686776.1 hypothetical protein [Kitasatospora purpeofusca]